MRIPTAQSFEAHECEQFRDALFDVTPVPLFDFETEGDVVEDRQVFE